MAKIGRTLSYINTSPKTGKNDESAGRPQVPNPSRPGAGGGAGMTAEQVNSLIATIGARLFLSKIKNDSTPYNLVVGNNLGVGKNLTVGGDVVSEKFTKDTLKGGYAIRKNEEGEYEAEADNIVARILARTYDLLVKHNATFVGDLSSEEFVSGFLAGKGWSIRMKEWLNAAGVKEKKSVAEFDDLVVRGSLRVYEFIVSQLLGENDNRIFTGMMEVDHYDATDGKVYLKTDNGRLYNPFRADDVIIVQQYGGNPSEENGYYVTKQYEFIVTEVGIGEMGEDRLDWVRFRNFTTSMEGGNESLITERDTLVRIDNLSDANRKGVIQLMSVGEDTPYMDFIYGAKTDPENSLKGRLGNLGGVYNPLFGWLKEFGAYLTNLYAVGEFVIAHTGEDVSDAIEISKGQFRTNFRQTTYDMSEEQNFFTNAAMTNNCEHWTLGSDMTEYFLVGDVPQFFNYDLYASESSYAGIAEWKGRDMLRLSASTLRQSNDLIRKAGTHKVHTGTTENEDGSYTDVYEDVPDKLYLSVRLYVAASGKVELGFVDSEGNFIDNDFHYSEELAAREDGYEVKLSGNWDGIGDFFITSTGDVYIDLLSLTDRPLENFKITTETAIEQTAQVISLLGSKLNGTDGTVTELALTVDAMGESISSLVTKTNSITNTINTSGWINSSAAVNIFSQQVTAQGIAKTADIKVYVDNKISGIKLTADQITIDGVTSVNKTFKIGKNGYMTCIGGTIGGFTINENTLTASTSINMVLSAEDSSGYPSIGWFGSGSTAYSSLGVAIHENYLGGQLYLSNVNQQQALVMPSGIILEGSKQIVQFNTGVQNISTGALLPAIQIRSKQYTTVTASLGFRGSRISFYVPDLPTEANAQAGEVYVDGNNNLKLKK